MTPKGAWTLLLILVMFGTTYEPACDGAVVAEHRDETKLFSFHRVRSTKRCSTKCRETSCFFAPTLRYGKYCGLGYSGCAGEAPCDGLDACCQAHDNCVGNDICNYLNVTCNQDLIYCLRKFELAGKPQFEGAKCPTSELVDVINDIIEIGVDIGKELNVTGKC